MKLLNSILCHFGFYLVRTDDPVARNLTVYGGISFRDRRCIIENNVIIPTTRLEKV